MAVKYFDWDGAKNAKLRAERGIGFEDIVFHIERVAAKNSKRRRAIASRDDALGCSPGKIEVPGRADGIGDPVVRIAAPDVRFHCEVQVCESGRVRHAPCQVPVPHLEKAIGLCRSRTVRPP